MAAVTGRRRGCAARWPPLAILAAAAAAVSWDAQYVLASHVKHTPAIATLEAGIPDAGALIFAALGIARGSAGPPRSTTATRTTPGSAASSTTNQPPGRPLAENFSALVASSDTTSSAAAKPGRPVRTSRVKRRACATSAGLPSNVRDHCVTNTTTAASRGLCSYQRRSLEQ